MDTSAQGLRVLVTAGAAGIGRAMARTFVEHGARVHICDVDTAALAAAREALPAVTQTVADVASVADVDRLFADVGRTLGGLECSSTTPASPGRPARWRISSPRTGTAASPST